MTGLDSNVLIYVLARHPDFFAAADAALRRAVAAGPVCLPTLTITEIMSGTADRRVLEFLESPRFHLYELTKPIAVTAGELRFASPGLKTADSIQLATALAAKADSFVTNDKRLHGLNVGVEILPLSGFAS